MPSRSAPDYAELHALSNFSFLCGASHPEEMVERAARLGYAALAITDQCSLAGVVRAHLAVQAWAAKQMAAKPIGAEQAGSPPPAVPRLIVGSELQVREGHRFVVLAMDRSGYGRLSRLITQGRRAAPKGEYLLALSDMDDGLPGCVAVWLEPGWPGPGVPAREPQAHTLALATWLQQRFGDRVWIGLALHRGPHDAARLEAAHRLGERSGLPLTAMGGARMHARSRRALADVLTAVRLRTTVAGAGLALAPNADACLRPRAELARLYPPALLTETLKIAGRCEFSLDELRYEYPEELVPGGYTPSTYLRELTTAGLRERWPRGAPEKVRVQVEHELALIEELGYEAYFLTVHDIARFARGRGILCQGRGSAANSAVCYCLYVTEVDPARMDMLFERFISRERNEPPDIDIDFEHQRREEVIQYLYAKYGRDRAALTATVITYQPRSAVRDVGKALGLDLAQVDRLAKSIAWWDGRKVLPERFAELGFDPHAPILEHLAELVGALIGFPRHLSQHTGGFVFARGLLSELVPIENASMPERTVIQWDKDDLDALGLLKVDVLALGMLSAIRRALELVSAYRGKPLTVSDVPAEDPAVYEMIQSADTVGVFQIESRAQMNMLPRLRPKTFYDLVIEVAIVRPGPIQGGMVHPYLRRRNGLEPVDYPSDAVRGVLERTLGVPIFQEQAMQLAVVAAGFNPGEADQLRRAMAAWRRKGGLGPFEQRLIDGMRERGYEEKFARQIFDQIQGFGEYGFPESHSASFALLVYVSAWLKCHEPAAFCAALLNSQPLGFYAPAQLVADARKHGVTVRPVDVLYSDWDATLEPEANGEPALRLGLRLIKGLSRATAEGIARVRASDPASIARASGPRFASAVELADRAGLTQADLRRLAGAGALASLEGHRHKAHWSVLGVEPPTPLLERPEFHEAQPLLRAPDEGQDLVADYASVGLTLGRHPLALLRAGLEQELEAERGGAQALSTAAHLRRARHGQRARVVGIVVNRQRPQTASGVIFMTLEDETGHINVVIWPRVAERQRREVLGGRLLMVRGTVEREGEVVHLVAEQFNDHSTRLGRLRTRSRDFG
ncbi:MAG: error-prone DNA polymerase [Gammaproteobacteria bacterium]